LGDHWLDMNNSTPPHSPALTALAAIIALSSTPLLAQAADGAASQTAPEIAVPAPAPVVQQAAVPAITVAPPAAEAAAPVSAQPVMRTMSTPVVHTGDDTAQTAETATQIVPAKRVVPATRARVVAPAPTAASRSPAPAVAADRSQAPISVARQQPQPAPTPVAAAPALPVAAPAPVAKTVATQSIRDQMVENDAGPIAGAVGLGLLAIGGIAFALRRRRGEDEFVATTPAADADITVAPAMAMPVAPVAATARATLPNGFDLSRFGRHAQAAYRGPTPDNPSHSLRRRLSRASFFDQREREVAEAGVPVQAAAAEPVAAMAAAKERDNGQVTVRLAPQRKNNGFGFVFQK
ncbi:MAG TPA: hypothetical protein VNT42_00925, partial [Sphingomonas sp.]|nr:hypothetical protein [Sphingomonas sp.]